MTLESYGRYVIREFRGSASRLAFFVACLAVGVAAIVVVAGISRGLDQGIRSDARELLAADISVRMREAPGEDVESILEGFPELERTDVRRQPGNIVAKSGPRAGRSLLVEYQPVDGTYPFYGSLGLEPAMAMPDALSDDTVVVMQEIADDLELEAGARVQLGEREFTVAAIATEEPDRVTGFLYIGPRVFMTKAAFASAGLDDLGTRVMYFSLFKIPDGMTPEELTAVGAAMDEALDPIRGVRVETYLEGRPGLRRGVERVEHYLGLTALLSLLLGGVGVAQAVRAWIAGRLDAIAVLKCLGARPREVFFLYAGQAALLGLLGSVAGVLAGVAVLIFVPPFFREHMPSTLIQPWQPASWIRGLVLGVSVALTFSVPPLLGVLRVSPARVLRRDAEPLPSLRGAAWATAALVLAGIVIMAFVQGGSAQLAISFSLGVGVTAAVLAGAAIGLTAVVARMPRDFGSVWIRHGLAALARPGASTLASMMGLGLGMLVLFCVAIVQGHLNAQLRSELPKDAPTAFMLDVRPDQRDGLVTVLEDNGANDVRIVPFLPARIEIVQPEPPPQTLQEAQEEAQGPPWGGRGGGGRTEFITYMEEFPADNEIIAGSLWNDPERPEVSLEEEQARRMGAEIGSIMTVQAMGTTLECVVTSIRSVEWLELGINFQVIVEPGYLESAPQMFIATARFPEGEEQTIQDAAAALYSNVTFVRVDTVLNRIAFQLQRIGWGVRFLGIFIIAAGVAVLAGTIAVESQRRARDVALFKTIGMARVEVLGLFASEYALIGLIAAIIGIGGGGFIAWGVITRGFEIPFEPSLTTFAFSLLAGMVIAVGAGMAASLGALRRKPIEVLRAE